MRIEQLGDGEPELAILGGVHGDEPCGVHAIEQLLDDDPVVDRPVKCVIANERALDRNKRYTETDLNRAFPGDPDGDDYETRLAHELVDELHGCTTLSMHSTQSYSRPFAIVEKADPLTEMIGPYLSIDAVVEAGPETFANALVGYVDVIEVECGKQGSEQAADNAVELVREFLQVTGAIDGDLDPAGALPVFELTEPIPKADGTEYAVTVENFQRVESGEPIATIDGHEIVAEKPFHPVLMSKEGYDAQFGYRAEKTDHLEHR